MAGDEADRLAREALTRKEEASGRALRALQQAQTQQEMVPITRFARPSSTVTGS